MPGNVVRPAPEHNDVRQHSSGMPRSAQNPSESKQHRSGRMNPVMRRAWALGLALGLVAHAAVSAPEFQKQMRAATFEVVIRKPERDALTYEKPLPLELIPFAERNDLYWSMGTAFAIGPDTYVSAGHVMLSGVGSSFGLPAIRDVQGKVYPVDRVLKFSLSEDFMVFTVQGAPPVPPLSTNTAFAVDDVVYAVGNALGDGVVIRDGLLTSTTPEFQDGRWKWLRFSAATSPGNSGGPLVDVQGRVLGVITAKSPNENLNYALPVERVLNASSKAATVDQRESFGLPLLQETAVAHFKDQFDLPLAYTEFSRRFVATHLKYYLEQRRALLAAQHEHLFPRGDSAKLLASAQEAFLPVLIVQNDDRSWGLGPVSREPDIKLPGDGFVTLGFTAGVGLFRVKRPNAASDAGFYTDSRVSMDLLLKSLKLMRPVGPQSIRITSMGIAQSDVPYTDTYQRQWRLRSWPMGIYDAQLFAMMLPVPDGAVGMVLIVPRGLQNVMTEQLKWLADYVQVSYAGSLPQWRAFLGNRDGLPALFERVKLDYSDASGLRYDSSQLRFNVPPDLLRISDRSVLSIHTTYVPEGKQFALRPAALILAQDGDTENFVGAYRQARPGEGAGKEAQQRWDAMLKRSGDFSGVPGHDAEYKKFWLRLVSGQDAVDSRAAPPQVLYELVFNTEDRLLPRHFDEVRPRLSRAIQVMEH